MNPSGGLFWHLHAWRHQAQWRNTCADIAQWLGQMPPSKDAHSELVILGASAGWMMPSAWLQSFQTVTTFDLDRWAAPLFRLRHGAALRASKTALQCNTADALTDLDAVLKAHPRALVLFDNVLGQLRFHTPSVDEASRRIASITARMHGRRWGSVHDAFSGRTQRRAGGTPAMQRSVQVPAPAPTPTSTSAPEYSSGSTGQPAHSATRPVALGRFSRQLHAQGEWLDHLTDHVFPAGTPVHHIAWPYRPGYCHWLQAGWINP